MPTAGWRKNTQFALLLRVVCGLLAGLLCYYVLTIKSDPRKSILLGIKNNQFYIVYQPVVNAPDSTYQRRGGPNALAPSGGW